MKTDEIVQKSIDIITQYYKNNLEPFFDSLAEDVLWFGPAENQVIRGKDNLLETFAKEDHDLTFVMGDIDAEFLAPSTNIREVLLHYDIYTYYPSGNMDKHDQRLSFTWREKRRPKGVESKPEICLVNIANLWKYDERDTIYPIHYETVMMPEYFAKKQEQFIMVKASNMAIHRLAIMNILYIEAIRRKAKTLVHTLEGEITINATLGDLEREYPQYFLRSHASYLVNPDHVQEIRRFKIKLTDGTELPVPEKKYTSVKKQLISRQSA